MSNHYFKFASICIFLAYICDCIDGYMARSYNMITKFGDWYDHISDAARSILVFYMLLNINYKLGVKYSIFLLTTGLFTGIFLSHQEIYYDKPQQSMALKVFIPFRMGANKENVHHYLKYSRYLGCGTYYYFQFMTIFFYRTA